MFVRSQPSGALWHAGAVITESPELEAALWGELVRLQIPARPVVLSTPWRVGAVVAYLFPADPVTLVDAGYDSPEARQGFAAAFEEAGRDLGELVRIIVTHGHTDHFGCAAWLQELSGCEVVMHEADAVRMRGWMTDRTRAMRDLYVPMGVPAEALDRYTDDDGRPALPDITPISGGESYPAGGTTLRVEHLPGHAAGHCVVIEERTGAVFAGDYLLSHTPTNSGLDLDPTHPTGRAPMLSWYNAGLRKLAGMDIPALFPGHGPPVTDHAALIARRLSKSGRRTEHVLSELGRRGPSTALELALDMYGQRVLRDPWGFMGDVVGRLDLLVEEGRARSQKRDDGVWIYISTQEGNDG